MVTDEVDVDVEVAVAGAVDDIALGLSVLKIVYASLSPGTVETMAGPMVTLVCLLDEDVPSSKVVACLCFF